MKGEDFEGVFEWWYWVVFGLIGLCLCCVCIGCVGAGRRRRRRRELQKKDSTIQLELADMERMSARPLPPLGPPPMLSQKQSTARTSTRFSVGRLAHTQLDDDPLHLVPDREVLPTQDTQHFTRAPSAGAEMICVDRQSLPTTALRLSEAPMEPLELSMLPTPPLRAPTHPTIARIRRASTGPRGSTQLLEESAEENMRL